MQRCPFYELAMVSAVSRGAEVAVGGLTMIRRIYRIMPRRSRYQA
jgi:hypothetical protein